MPLQSSPDKRYGSPRERNNLLKAKEPIDVLDELVVCLAVSRRDGRAVECTGLENRRRLIAYPGFESLSLRHFFEKGQLLSWPFFVSEWLNPLLSGCCHLNIKMRMLFGRRAAEVPSHPHFNFAPTSPQRAL